VTLTPGSLALCVSCAQWFSGPHDCREPRRVPMSGFEGVVMGLLEASTLKALRLRRIAAVAMRRRGR
jgi:hypothetical protein